MTQLSEIFSADLDPVVYFQALIIIIIGFVLARVASLALRRAFRESASPHVAVLTQRAAFYLILSLSVITALHQLGFNFGVLLGAAGILTIAVGFASQTSMSNLISGLFLIGERPFAIGDLIKIGDTVGEVLSIDLLSVKLRLFDNTYVRIPNETIIKSEVSTLTKFPIRRIDLKIGIAFKEDVARVRQVLLDVADKNPLCLEEPSPLFVFQGFGDSSINLQFSIWVKTEEYLTLKNSIQLEIKAAFDQEQIEIPFPHRTLYASTETEPFPVTIVTKVAGSDLTGA
ncbi:MAG: mechanosensitive ion channel protein [Anaerolineae bacterium SG8_19]|nr:MAG: mechanosensitive ion channel protein [Anaerolineae bacterium SG8_19]